MTSDIIRMSRQKQAEVVRLVITQKNQTDPGPHLHVGRLRVWSQVDLSFFFVSGHTTTGLIITHIICCLTIRIQESLKLTVNIDYIHTWFIPESVYSWNWTTLLSTFSIFVSLCTLFSLYLFLSSCYM